MKFDLNDDFEEFHELGFRNHRGGRASGGMSLLVHKSLMSFFSIITSDSYHFWCKLDRQVCNGDRDLYICFLYIPPSTSTLLKSGISLNFEILQVECASFEKKGLVLIFGDTNARTNNINDFIENDEVDDYLPIDDQYLPDLTLEKRINVDKSPSNTNGTAMIEFCKSTGFRILNGRIDKNNSSGFTCFSSNGNSVVDYALLKQELFPLIKSFRVNEVTDLSDHCALEIEISTQFESENNDITPVAEAIKRPLSNMEKLKNNFKNKFYVNQSTLDNLSSLIQGSETDDFLNDMNDQLRNKEIPVDLIIDSLRSKLIEISRKCFLVKKVFTKNDNKARDDKSWFDSACREKKQKLNYAKKMYQESLRIINSAMPNISCCELRDAYFQQRREYKALLKSKRKLFLIVQKDELWSLKSESPKTFWKKLNKGKNKVLLNFTNNQLFDYFDHLLKNDLDGPGNNREVPQHDCFLDAPTLRQINTELNCPITIEEVQNMVANLKTGKAPGLDMISSELLKNLNYKFYLVFVLLFNRVFQSGDFPEEWAIGIIVLLFKGGNKSDLDNYRGITLLSIFGKLFIGILLQRLQKTVAKYEILRENQIAYRKGYQTSDHIFTLRAIIEHTFEVKKCPLYICFIDFSKAFDSIDHVDLIKKLCMYGIQGNVLHVIASLYSKVKSCVKGNDELTDLFSCSRGVRKAGADPD